MTPEKDLIARKLLPEMHKETAVTNAVKKKERLETVKVANDPVEKVNVYIERLEKIFLHTNQKTKERNISSLKPHIHEEYVIKKEDVPDVYFELQQRIARERGQPVDVISDEMKDQMISVIIEDQEKRLDEWIDYLSSSDAVYPAWFKYFAFRNIVKLSQFDKERGEFKKRSKSTTAPFPDIYQEALAIVCDKYIALAHGQVDKFANDTEFTEYANSKFPKLYAVEIQKTLQAGIEGRQRTDGEWVQYRRGHEEDAVALYQSLQGKGTGWCTAGQSTANGQIEGGDFYVFYTYKDVDAKEGGTATEPRIAIRWESDQIVEVRGVLPNQGLEPQLVDTLDSKLNEFGDKAETFQKKTADMKRLTEIDEKEKAQEHLSHDDLIFLYEAKSKIEGFGYKSDPRIQEILSNRDGHEDLTSILDNVPKDKVKNFMLEAIQLMPSRWIPLLRNVSDEIQQEIVDNLTLPYVKDREISRALCRDIQHFSSIDIEIIALRIAKSDHYQAVLEYIHNFQDIEDQSKIVEAMLDQKAFRDVARHIWNFAGIDCRSIAFEIARRGAAEVVLHNVQNFQSVISFSEIFTVVPEKQRLQLIIDAGDDMNPYLEEAVGLMEDMDMQKLAEQLTQRKAAYIIMRNTETFKEVDFTKIIEIEISQGREGKINALEQLRRIGSIDGRFFPELFDFDGGYMALRQINRFTDIDEDEVIQMTLEDPSKRSWLKDCGWNFGRITQKSVDRLVKEGCLSDLVQNIGAINPAVHRSVFEYALTDRDASASMSFRLKNFIGLNEEDYETLFERKIVTASDFVRNSLNHFSNLSKTIAKSLIDGNRAYEVAHHISHFDSKDHDAIAKMLMEDSRGINALLNTSQYFVNLQPETLKMVLKYAYDNSTKKEIRQRLKTEYPTSIDRMLSRFKKPEEESDW